jgi:hypothetical protein
VGFHESLNDFAACIAVAAGTAPDAYPAWSDGFKNHFAEILLLWAEIQPQVRDDVGQAQRIDILIRKMSAAFEAGDVDGFREAALMMHRLDVSKLR